MTSLPRSGKPLKILFLTAYFPPEVGAAQTRTHELVSQLASMGHEVSVLTTFPNYPSGIVPKEWRGHFFWKGQEERIRIYRIWSYTAPKGRVYKRVLSYLSFAFFASLAGPLLPSADVLIVESHPMFNGIAALIVSFLKRIPYILNVADLWPASAAQVGILNRAWMVRVLEGLELMFYKRAALILALTGGIRDKIIRQGIASSKVVLFRNAVDPEFFRPEPDTTAARKKTGVSPDAFMVLYAGTFGMMNDVGTIIRAAALFHAESENRVHFVLAGDGAGRNNLEATARQLALNNVTFLGPCPKSHIPALLNACDCVAIALPDIAYAQGTLPRKLFEAMATAKPVVLAARGEAETLIQEAGAGICVDSQDAQGICDAILRMLEDRQAAERMGRQGREYIKAQFCQTQRAQELNSYLQRIAVER